MRQEIPERKQMAQKSDEGGDSMGSGGLAICQVLRCTQKIRPTMAGATMEDQMGADPPLTKSRMRF